MTYKLIQFSHQEMLSFFTESYPFSTAVIREPEEELPLVEMVDEDDRMLVDGDEDIIDNTHTEHTEVTVDIPVVASEEAPLRRGSRAYTSPRWMQDYVGSLQINAGSVVGTSVTPPTFPYTIFPILSLSYVTYLFNISTTHEPTSYQEASTQT